MAGDWFVRIDSLDLGERHQWYNQKFAHKLKLPGSLTTNGIGNDIALNTPWMGSIFDSSWFFAPQYAEFRKRGNIKIPFWLQPTKYYQGAAWYQKNVVIPPSWQGRHIELFIERSHWETIVWVDNHKIGMQNSLGTSHVFDLTKFLTPGKHTLTIRVDNRLKDFNVGQNSHSISDHTQSNWNGMIGKLSLIARPLVYIENIQLYPNINDKKVVGIIKVKNETGRPIHAQIEMKAVAETPGAGKLNSKFLDLDLTGDSTTLEVDYNMGDRPLLWNEFSPNLYNLNVRIKVDNISDNKNVLFGMREFAIEGTHFTINGQPTFLRGTLECAIFPLTGYPPTDVSSWMRIFKIARSYGLNHMRFHSWCPPEAAFAAADRSGFYLQVECSSWANWGTTIGDGFALDEYIMSESERMIRDYGNHPSFCMLTYGNEPGGKNHIQYVSKFVEYWKRKDQRRLYTAGAGWPAVKENNYHNISEPRIQLWNAGLKSIINSQPPRTNYDWKDIISQWNIPVVSHEIGQWCVYPDFKEIKKYTGILKAKNFEIFQYNLNKHGMGRLADSFLLASGKLQALCYKADIEAALRTPGLGGFQLLDLHDFPGQGTALVGVLNPFWNDKGYITGKEYSQFCNATVPLARFPKMIYLNDEEISVPIEVAHFANKSLKDIIPKWIIKNATGKIVFQGELPQVDISLGNGISLGRITQNLSSILQPSRLTLNVTIGTQINSWDFFVYPAHLPQTKEDILVTQELNAEALRKLNDGGSVLLTLPKNSIKPEWGGKIAVGFSSIFWNTAWTNGQAPHTLGILCNPNHPALKEFPTQYHSNWQWWDGMSYSNAVMLDSVSAGLRPIVRVIDDWVTNRSLGLIFECKVGNGKVLVSSIDLLKDQARRPEARQLLFSLKKYMETAAFNPGVTIDLNKLKSLVNK
ncbi:MAG TPA: glycoside hydrolase family 2 TIM barrel-domain containing protein [Chitinophagaceae bacterium]